MRALPLLLLLAALFSGCGEDNRNQKAVEAVIQEEVQKRVADFHNSRMDRCQRDANEDASVIADSILLKQARLNRDTLSKPPKPSKPERPELKTLKDSLKVAPILRRDSGVVDSINR